MFMPAPGRSMFDGWAEQYRRWRGIDRWPLVDATLIHREALDDDEGGRTYRLTLRYKPAVGIAADTYCVENLTVDDKTNLVYVSEGEKIPIHCHPEHSDRICPQDLSQLATDIGKWLFFGGFIMFMLLCWSLSGFKMGGAD